MKQNGVNFSLLLKSRLFCAGLLEVKGRQKSASPRSSLPHRWLCKRAELNFLVTLIWYSSKGSPISQWISVIVGSGNVSLSSLPHISLCQWRLVVVSFTVGVCRRLFVCSIPVITTCQNVFVRGEWLSLQHPASELKGTLVCPPESTDTFILKCPVQNISLSNFFLKTNKYMGSS